MIFLISAPPRTGKTLFCIKKIFEYLNDGRAVYTNIAGINIDGVRTITDSPYYPFDWRDLPNDSVVFYDEAQQHLSFGNKKIPKKYAHRTEEILDIGDSFDIHGHFGYDIFLITQKPNLIRSDLLGFVSVHYVLRRKWGQNFATIWEFGEAMTTWSKSTADSALNKTQWRYPKYLYKYYKSAESHTVKSSFPLKYIFIALIPIFILGYSGFGLFKNFFGDKEEVQAVHAAQPPSEPKQQNNQSNPYGLSYEDFVLLKEEADYLGMTVEQLVDLKRPELKNVEHQQRLEASNSYNYADPFNYGYLQGTSQRIFSGCLGDSKRGYKAYDTQGSLIDNAHPDLCKRVMAGERPYTPKAQNYDSQMASQDYNPEINKKSVEQTVQPNVEHHQANNIVPEHLQARTVNGANQL